MDPAAFFARSSVLVVAGKGGVGKSTVTAALAVAAARQGLRVLAVELEGRSELPRALGLSGAVDWEECLAFEDPSSGSVVVRRLRPDEALVEWLGARGLGPVVRRLRRSGALEVVSFAIPGIREVLVLGKLKSIERDGSYDLIVVDAPATGHALTLLTSPAGLAAAARSGPVRRVAEEVVELLRDPRRCRVLLVTLPRELAVDETIEAAYEVEERAGVALAEVLVNQYRPPSPLLDRPLGPDESQVLGNELAGPVEAARAFASAREHTAAAEVERLAAALPLPVLSLRALDAARIGPDELDVLAAELVEGISHLVDAP
jgi:anion-transporting  ArsA/GET3 family ATPase